MIFFNFLQWIDQKTTTPGEKHDLPQPTSDKNHQKERQWSSSGQKVTQLHDGGSESQLTTC